MVSRTTLADARLAAGEWTQARALLEEAEAMQAQRQPNSPQLSSLGGHRYCELLLCPAERAAWCESATLAEPSELLRQCAEVFERATRAMEIASRNHWTLDIALDLLTCGRAALYTTRTRLESYESTNTKVRKSSPTTISTTSISPQLERSRAAALIHVRLFGEGMISCAAEGLPDPLRHDQRAQRSRWQVGRRPASFATGCACRSTPTAARSARCSIPTHPSRPG